MLLNPGSIGCPSPLLSELHSSVCPLAALGCCMPALPSNGGGGRKQHLEVPNGTTKP